MLRALVLLFLMLNAALFFWIRSPTRRRETDREPQRLQREVSPASIKVLPDLPAAGPRAARPRPSAASAKCLEAGRGAPTSRTSPRPSTAPRRRAGRAGSRP